MAESETTKKSLKEKAKHEFVEYWINVAWLTLVFASFTVYRRLVLSAYDITYTHYWVALIEALILGKVIMIGPSSASAEASRTSRSSSRPSTRPPSSRSSAPSSRSSNSG